MSALSDRPLQNPPGATGALVCGILSIVICWVPIAGLVLGIVALVLASKGKAAANAAPDRLLPGGIRVGGFVCGIIGTVFSALYLIWWIMFAVLIAKAPEFGVGIKDALEQQRQHIERSIEDGKRGK